MRELQCIIAGPAAWAAADPRMFSKLVWRCKQRLLHAPCLSCSSPKTEAAGAGMSNSIRRLAQSRLVLWPGILDHFRCLDCFNESNNNHQHFLFSLQSIFFYLCSNNVGCTPRRYHWSLAHKYEALRSTDACWVVGCSNHGRSCP